MFAFYDRREVWQQFTKEVKSAEFIQGNLLVKDKVEVPVGKQKIVLSTYRIPGRRYNNYFTYASVAYTSRIGFRFRLTRKNSNNIVDDFRLLTGTDSSRHIKTGNYVFDEKFVLTANNADLARSVFRDPKIQEAVAAQSSLNLCVRNLSPLNFGGDEQRHLLEFRADEFIRNTKELAFLCILMREIVKNTAA
jgi:hypothetical protein